MSRNDKPLDRSLVNYPYIEGKKSNASPITMAKGSVGVSLKKNISKSTFNFPTGGSHSSSIVSDSKMPPSALGIPSKSKDWPLSSRQSTLFIKK